MASPYPAISLTGNSDPSGWNLEFGISLELGAWDWSFGTVCTETRSRGNTDSGFHRFTEISFPAGHIPGAAGSPSCRQARECPGPVSGISWAPPIANAPRGRPQKRDCSPDDGGRPASPTTFTVPRPGLVRFHVAPPPEVVP